MKCITTRTLARESYSFMPGVGVSSCLKRARMKMKQEGIWFGSESGV